MVTPPNSRDFARLFFMPQNYEFEEEIKMTEATAINKWEEAPDILKPQEAAKLMRIGRNRIYELAAKDGFPRLEIGERHFVIPKEALRQWINRQLGV